MKWFKKDIKTMRQAIASFWLVNRPLSDSMSERTAALTEVRTFLQDRRADVVIYGIAELGGIAEERERKDLEFVEHLRTHSNVYGKATPEMIARFSESAAESHKEADRARQLIDRIRAEGLPLEVINFDPVKDASLLG